MKRSSVLAATLFASATWLAAQAGIHETPPLYRGPKTDVSGVFVTPVAGIPFTATVMIDSEQKLANGATEVKRAEAFIARDSSGRIRNERRMLVTESFHGTPPLLSVHIFDPVTRLNSFYTPGSGIVRQAILPSVSASDPTHPGGEDLGYTTLNGMQAKGTRLTRIIPAQFSGTGQPVQVTDEYWYSEDLHMNILEQHSDPRTGEQTVAILSIQREEPAASLFEMPAGYKIVDMTPPQR
jgi:hypothetical protein